MKKLGLALSGGGFRATLYHLGLVRFLRDANILQHVSHITAVSGGSVMAAHLGLNWDRYTGSEKEFDEAASELLNFARLDVRNRILRRYGLGIILRGPRRLVGLSNRRTTAAEAPTSARDRTKASTVAHDARALHASAGRRIWSTALDFRDWVSWVYVPILVPILVLLPYFVVQYHRESKRAHQIMKSLAQGSRDLEQMTRLLHGPMAPWKGQQAEELPADAKVDLKSFVILQDSRIIDLRNWTPATSGKTNGVPTVYGYRRLKVLKKPDGGSSDEFRVSVLALSPQTQVRFPPQQLAPKLYSRPLAGSSKGEQLRHFEVGADFRKVPSGDFVDLIYEQLSPGLFLRNGVKSTTLSFEVEAETVELTRWLLMPEGMEYESFAVKNFGCVSTDNRCWQK